MFPSSQTSLGIFSDDYCDTVQKLNKRKKKHSKQERWVFDGNIGKTGWDHCSRICWVLLSLIPFIADLMMIRRKRFGDLEYLNFKKGTKSTQTPQIGAENVSNLCALQDGLRFLCFKWTCSSFSVMKQGIKLQQPIPRPSQANVCVTAHCGTNSPSFMLGQTLFRYHISSSSFHESFPSCLTNASLFGRCVLHSFCMSYYFHLEYSYLSSGSLILWILSHAPRPTWHLLLS